MSWAFRRPARAGIAVVDPHGLSALAGLRDHACVGDRAYDPRERRKARAAKDDEFFREVLARPLNLEGRGVADAVDWTQHSIDRGHCTRDRVERLFEAAVVVQELAAVALDQGAVVLNEVGATADAKDSLPGECPGGELRRVGTRLVDERASHARGELALERFVLRRQLAHVIGGPLSDVAQGFVQRLAVGQGSLRHARTRARLPELLREVLVACP